MKIGIIGTGKIGSALARKLSATGHELRVANSRGVEVVKAFANEIEAPKKLERLIDLYRQGGANITHADIIAMNR